MKNICPECNAKGTVDGREVDDRYFYAVWFMSCSGCNLAWVYSIDDGEIENVEKSDG